MKKNVIKRFGIALIVAISFAALSMTACDNGGGTTVPLPPVPPLPPELLSPQERWFSWIDPSSTATLNYSVDSGGVCTITVGGIAETDGWKASTRYLYTAKTDTRYAYIFKAWTESGTRGGLGIQYYEDNDEKIYLGSSVELTKTPKTYTVTGKDLPKSGVRQLQFQCANQTGTFYVDEIEIVEYEIGTLTITNFSGSPGLTENQWVYGYSGDMRFCGGISGNEDDGFSSYLVNITGSSITLDVYIVRRRATNKWEYLLFKGNETINKGELYLRAYDDNNTFYYKNKVPITFTNGSATINFSTQMEVW